MNEVTDHALDPSAKEASCSAPECPPPIRAVLYDVDGTFYHLSVLRLLMASRLAARLVVTPTATWRTLRILRAYRRALEALRPDNGGPGVAPADADTAWDPQCVMTARRLGLAESEVQAVVDAWMIERPARLLPRCARRPLLRAVSIIRAAGLRQGVYSDYPPYHKLIALGVDEMMQVCLWSAHPSVRAWKPSPVGFLRAAEALGVAPAQCLYVGDRPAVDGAGARAAGMRFVNVRALTARRVARAENDPARAIEHLFPAR